jgi:hypothetical protein
LAIHIISFFYNYFSTSFALWSRIGWSVNLTAMMTMPPWTWPNWHKLIYRVSSTHIEFNGTWHKT